ncbi:MAG: asparagine synthetase B [Alphaproteobacteria bacterium]|nr:MAG: asparagine synthetase B [Alphaproteobacteria bacterium]
MSGVCGWLAVGRPVAQPESALAAMAGALPTAPGDALATSAGGTAALALRGPGAALVRTADEIWCAVDGEVAWTDGTALPAGPLAEQVIEAYRRHGPQLLGRLRGSFSLALVDGRRSVALIAVDRRGVKRMAWQLAPDGTLLFASTIDALREHPAGRFELSPQAIFDYAHLSVVPAPQTIFRDVGKLHAAEYLLFENGRVSLGRYWEPPAEIGGRDVGALCRATVDGLRGAVRRAMDDTDGGGTGAFLSGGLDSSTVLGLATEHLGRPVKSFTIGFDSEIYDEQRYARIAAEHFASPHFTYHVTPADAAALLPRIAAAYDEPFGNSSAVPTFFCAGLAREHGISLMLAGDGGDEIFGGNERYVQQQVFELYYRLPGAARSALEAGLLGLPGVGALPVLRKAASYVRRARTPMPDRMLTYSFLGGDRLNEVFEPDFLAQVDPDGPLAALRRTYARHADGPLLRRMLQFDMQVTLADNDLRKVTTMCEQAGMPVRFPFLDEAVIDFGATLPADLLIRRFRLRDFYKRAFKGILPDPTLQKQKHGFGMPVRFWIAQDTALREAIGDALMALKGRGIVRAAFLDRLLQDREQQAAGAFGQLGWYLAVLEGWLDHRRLGSAV